MPVRWAKASTNIFTKPFGDIPLMAKTLQEILMSRDALIFLLQSLGFVINNKNSALELASQPNQLSAAGLLIMCDFFVTTMH